MLFLPERQNLLCSGPGQCGGGAVKVVEGGERKKDGSRRAAYEEVIDVDDESADGEEAKRVHVEEAGEEKEQEVEGEKEAEMEGGVGEEGGPGAGADETLP